MPTHGSMTKAGKVRNQTPKITPKPKNNLSPKARNQRNYVRRFLQARREERFRPRQGRR